MAKQTFINHIVIHCAATPPNAQVRAADIRRWHKDRGWRDIGYHFVIGRDGTIELGRDINVQGAHVAGWNRNSLGICLVGGVGKEGRPESNYTQEQWLSLELLVRGCHARWPGAEILGHCDFPGVKKACPSFDVSDWLTTMDII